MADTRWRQIEALFDHAVALPAAEREAYLAGACGEDRALRHEVETLLASVAGADDALRETVATNVARLASAVAPSLVDTRVGAYRLLELIGEGGMGAVYRAERDDDAFRKQVAVKVLRRGLGAVADVARFLDERQILASLDHPAIVRLLDGGTTDAGLPYLVMEHVDGVPLTRYTRTRSIRERVVLMRRVCAAVQHAHQHLVVHRDLKPANILVDATGAPKLLDFGIAKLLTEQREARTRTGHALLTFEYASPEQARGDAVSVATDVYALGAVLYEVLTEQPPQAASDDLIATLRRICEVDAPRPSSVAPTAVRRELVGDLDNIVMHALQKRPGARYPSVAALADDLERYLDGRPVLAREATLRYRAAKFVARHRGKLTLATLVTTALVTATVTSVRQAARADHHARHAARQTRALLIEQGAQELAAGRASRALPYLAAALRQGEDTPALRVLLAEASRPLLDQVGDTVTVPGGLTEIEWAPDGSTIAVTGHRGVVRLYDAELRLRATLDRGTEPFWLPQFSPDGRWFAASSNGFAALWDAATGRLVHLLTGTPSHIDDLKLDERHLVALGDDGTLLVLDIATGATRRTMTTEPRVRSIALAPDGRHLWAARLDGPLERWSLDPLAVDGRLTGHTDVAGRLCATRDGRLVSASADGTARIWDATTMEPRARLDHGEPLFACELDRAEATLLTGGGSAGLRVWDAHTGESRRALSSRTGYFVREADLSADGSRVVSADSDNTFRIWDVATGRLLRQVEAFAAAGDAPGSIAGALEARFAPSGARVAAVSGTDAKVWRVTRAPLTAELPIDYGLYGLATSPDERRLAAVGLRGGAIWDAASGAEVIRLDVGPARLYDVSWRPDGSELAVSGADGVAIVVAAATGARRHTLTGHGGTVNGVSYRGDGAQLLTACNDGRARIYDAASGALVREFVHPGKVMAATWSDDGQSVVTAGWDGVARIWDAATGELRRTIVAGSTQLLHARLSHDGQLVAASGHDGEVAIWRVRDGARVRSLDGHTGPATSVAWSPDGALLVSSGDDESVRVWDAATGRQLIAYHHPGPIMQAHWSRDGRRVISVSHAGTLRTWALDRDPRPVDEILRFVAARSPWELRDGRLVLRRK